MNYSFKEIEKKWRDSWKKNPYFAARNDHSGKKFYCLDMFPYPSGSGLHVGHWKGYILSDVYARMKWHQGYDVLHPMGWDAFGLPAENDAIKKGIHPKVGTARNIATFKEQMSYMGAMYDWSREIDTTDPEYYKWTQWIFLVMYKMGLAYESSMPINWCPSCLTGLANEEVVNDGCERCGTAVEKKPIRQWVLKITNYAEKLLNDLNDLDWPEKVKLMQQNWIGKSNGVFITFTSESGKEVIVFTTRPDTIYGVDFVVIAPDHDLASSLITSDRKAACTAYQQEIAHRLDRERLEDAKEKTGIFTGSYVINPLNGRKVPLYLANYVVKDYGTGAVMGVPGDDERDYEFAQKYSIEITPIIEYYDPSKGFESDGKLINSGPYTGMDAKKAIDVVINDLEKVGKGKRHTTYKLRDWIFSRQRYWGEPIPLVHCQKCGIVPVPESELPVRLPEVEKYQPTGTGESPLAAIDAWVNTSCPQCKGAAKRETNTMPQWAGSCWYFLRYPNPQLSDKAFSPEDMKHWMPVDLYVGGIEHAVLHLLYARFYVKVLHDAGYLPFKEPFKRLFNQGMVCMLSTTSGRVEKMSKSKGNVVTQEQIIEDFGSDTLRMYELFMGPPELDNEWQTDAIRGVFNYLNRMWTYLTMAGNVLPVGQSANEKSRKRFHRFLKDYTDRINDYRVNTAVASAMEYVNDLNRENLKLDRALAQDLLTALSIMVPHFASELLEVVLGVKLEKCVWPEYDATLAAVSDVEIAIQVNGKLRGTLQVKKGITQADAEVQARATIARWLEGVSVVKVIFVADKLINFVVKA